MRVEKISPDDRLLGQVDVSGMTNMGKTALYTAVRDGSFPAPVRVGKRAVAWKNSAVQEWISSRPPVNFSGRAANEG